jgi:DNA (cytosine-5)-methyltransferase 1
MKAKNGGARCIATRNGSKRLRTGEGELNGVALCAGVGGLERGIERVLPECRTVCYVEGETYAASVLASKMGQGRLHSAPIWSNVRTFDGKPWRGVVDWISGGFPCQPFSVAGKQLGEDDPRHLWPQFVRIIGEVRPRLVFLENVPGVVKLGGASIASDLADLGYRFAWTTLRASDVGAPHHRRRWFCVADAYREGEPRIPILPKMAEFSTTDVPHTNNTGQRKQWRTLTNETPHEAIECRGWWSIEPGVRRVVDGMADRVDRLRACGNGVVPQQAETAFRYLIECLNAVN